MENTTLVKVAINNPADIVVIVGYFITIIGVGIWVRWATNDFYMQETWKHKSVKLSRLYISVYVSNQS